MIVERNDVHVAHVIAHLPLCQAEDFYILITDLTSFKIQIVTPEFFLSFFGMIQKRTYCNFDSPRSKEVFACLYCSYFVQSMLLCAAH